MTKTDNVDMFVRLTRKLAEVVNGIDISHCTEGDVIALPEAHARMLIAERWAERLADERRLTYLPKWRSVTRDVAADQGPVRQRNDKDAAAPGQPSIAIARHRPT